MKSVNLTGLIVVLVASSGQSPVQRTAIAGGLESPSVMAAPQLAAVEVSLVSVSPGTPSGEGDWCIDAVERVMLTAHVVDLATQREVTEGTIVWQVCQGGRSLAGFPKEDCDAHGAARWGGAVISDLSFDSTPSIGSSPLVPVLGFRLQYRPAAGSGFKRATSQPFNLDKTCAP
jgi:hypothetical protein